MKNAIIAVLVCVIIVGGFFLGMNYGEKKSNQTPANTTNATGTESATTNVNANAATNEVAKTEAKNTNTTNSSSSSSKMTDEDYYKKAAEYVRVTKPKEEDHINTKPGYHKFVDYEGFGVAEEDGVTYAYMWIVDMSYYKEDGKVEQGSGSSMAYKVKFKNGEVVDVENPTDGAGQQESIKKMFPSDVAKKVMSYNYDFEKLDKMVDDYYKNN